MKPLSKQLKVIFAGVAGVVVLGGGVAAIALQAEAPVVASPAPHAQVPSAISLDVQASVVRVVSDNVIYAEVKPWVAQRMVVSVCARTQTNTPRPCDYVADFTTVRQGQGVVLRNMARNTSGVLAHALPAPNMNFRPRSDKIEGPVRARVTHILDGDTVQVVAETLPGYFVTTDIRLGGLDTPEKKGRAKCASEIERNRQSTAATTQLVGGKQVTLLNIEFEKYGGRMLGDIKTPQGSDLSQTLVSRGFARPYDGGTKRGWCNLS